MAATGCASADKSPGGDGSAGSSAEVGGSAANGGGQQPGDVYNNPDYSNPDDTVDVPEIVQVPGGDAGDGSGPTCGASRLAAQQIVVDMTVDVPQEVTEEVTEEVPEEVSEEVTTEVTTTKPVSLYIMFDQSASMAAKLWSPAVTALKAFVNDPNSAGIGVGIQYFPLSGGQCSTGAKYNTPEVPIGLLPDQATLISNSLNKHSATGIGTPIEGALRGVTQYCESYQAAHPDEQCVAVLVTDGQPELDPGCIENSDQLAAIAKSANDQGVITFAVGLQGANFTLLDKIATQGGAPDCDTTTSRFACDLSTSGADKLADALSKIRETVVTTETHTETHIETHTVTHTETHTVVHTEIVQQVQQTALACEWSIPTPPTGQSFDQNKVNIRFTDGDHQTTFVRVPSKAECRPDAWYFDDPAQPTRFIACDDTCGEITATTTGTIDILLGCATIVPS